MTAPTAPGERTDVESWRDVSTPAKRFRFVAVIEAITWALLLAGMGLKYGAGIESATMIVGALHGAAFVVYVVVSLLVARSLRWDWTVTLLALAASVPPFFTIIFEWWAKREGYLAELSAERPAGAVDPESEPADHFPWSIVAAVVFFPLGLVAVAKSVSVGRLWAAGQDGAARTAGEQARNLVILSFAAAIVVAVMVGLLLTVGPPGS